MFGAFGGAAFGGAAFGCGTDADMFGCGAGADVFGCGAGADMFGAIPTIVFFIAPPLGGFAAGSGSFFAAGSSDAPHAPQCAA
jgi:hypothetical protein